MVRNPSLDFIEDKNAIEDGNDNKDILVKLIRNMVIGKHLSVLPLGYLIIKGRLSWNEELNKIAKL